MTQGQLRFFASMPQPCGYLERRQSISVFADPGQSMTTELYSRLVEYGFRRSGDYVYRPECPACRACIPAKVSVEDFRPSRSQRRCWRNNRDLDVRVGDASGIDRRFELYRQYISQRHAGGSMDDPDAGRYRSFLHSDWCETVELEFWLGKQLVAVAVTDLLDSGVSAFYTFFDPAQRQRSLGTFAILWQIEEARRRNLPWVYLGYWIESCDKMSYKSQYRPLWVRVDGYWRPLPQ